uniref:Putative ribonuclease H-like domain-containing protein n=1 Tax=Tanacetum cinerariifolium TaxID=118510 RepID=A0A6L2M3X2_TANCI|nr:putative ribonuclease H-like domain-containing protein [Tanacetum cinerariifolium]
MRVHLGLVRLALLLSQSCFARQAWAGEERIVQNCSWLDQWVGSCTRPSNEMISCTVKGKPLVLSWGRTPRLDFDVRTQFQHSLCPGIFRVTHVSVTFCYPWVRPIGTEWVLQNKKDKRGIVIRNKARLVAQGHTQEEGIDYEEVFAPVSWIEAIRLFLDYASFIGFTVYQIDVKSAFIYGTIDEEIYVKQPPGFQDPWPPRVTLGRLLAYARGLGFKPRRRGFPSGAKKEWGLSPKANVRVLHTAQLDVTGRSKFPLAKVTNEVNGTPNALTEQNRGLRITTSSAHLTVKAYSNRAGNSDAQGNITISID